jgi:7,8-dihydroneopterin aldolase/epimerase/oxygenase
VSPSGCWLPTTQYQLVETLAHNLALLLLSEFPIDWIRVSINKPGAIRDSRDVGVSIERRRADLGADLAGLASRGE